MKSPITTTLALYKPHGFISRFTSDGSKHRPLSAVGPPPLPKDVWPVGRLDADSEGLLVLSSDKSLVDRLLSPKREHSKTYLVQVERIPDAAALAALEAGVLIDGELTRPARARLLDVEPVLPPRDPPIRVRKSVPAAWIALQIVEGKNRQVRRMTAAVGHPTLRLVRSAIGGLELEALGLAPGAWRALSGAEIERLLKPLASTTMPR